MSHVLRVGFVGLGNQGAPMAVAMGEKYELHVWARREDPVVDSPFWFDMLKVNPDIF